MIVEITVKVWDCGCEKCGHSWVSKNDVVPRVCPSCHAATWNSSIAGQSPKVDEWEGWSGEIKEFERSTGDYVTYRHDLKKTWIKKEISRERSTDAA